MRKRVLSNLLKCEYTHIYVNGEDINSYRHNGVHYLVLTEKEANNEAKRQILNYIPLLNADLINKHLKAEVNKKSLEPILNKWCENCLELLVLFINDYNEFINEAINIYGRGYFIGFNDKNEYQIKYKDVIYYIYRLI